MCANFAKRMLIFREMDSVGEMDYVFLISISFRYCQKMFKNRCLEELRFQKQDDCGLKSATMQTFRNTYIHIYST